MADLTADPVIAANYRTYFNSQSDVGREAVIKITNGTGPITDAEIFTITNYITMTHGSGDGLGTGDSPWVVAAIGTADGAPYDSSTTQEIFMRIQGTGELTAASAVAGIGCTIEIVAYFAPLH